MSARHRLHRGEVWQSPSIVPGVLMWVHGCLAYGCSETSSHRTQPRAYAAAVAHYQQRHPRRRRADAILDLLEPSIRDLIGQPVPLPPLDDGWRELIEEARREFIRAPLPRPAGPYRFTAVTG